MRNRDRWILLIVALAAVLLEGSGVAWASPWSVGLTAGTGEVQAGGVPPTAPASPASACSVLVPTVKVSWTAVTPPANGSPAISYSILESVTSASSGYTVVATGVTGTSWTSGDLASGTYWFEVAASFGTNWLGSKSAATAERMISMGLVCT